MCEILAINGRRRIKANPYLKEFFTHSVKHPDGWGIAWRDRDDLRVVKEPLAAYESTVAEYTLAEPIRTRKLIAHIRMASRGNVTYENCHPFIGSDDSHRSWILAHNGTIVDETQLEDYVEIEVGETDSEQIMLYLIDVLNHTSQGTGHTLEFAERFNALEKAIFYLAQGNKLNLAIDDGEYLYVHTNTVRDTLYLHDTGNAAIICTQPLATVESWEPLPHNRLIALRHGEIRRIGQAHDGSFDEMAFMEKLNEEERRIQAASAGL